MHAFFDNGASRAKAVQAPVVSCGRPHIFFWRLERSRMHTHLASFDNGASCSGGRLQLPDGCVAYPLITLWRIADSRLHVMPLLTMAPRVVKGVSRYEVLAVTFDRGSCHRRKMLGLIHGVTKLYIQKYEE